MLKSAPSLPGLPITGAILAVLSLAATLRCATAAAQQPAAEAERTEPPAPLITRDRITLNLAGAERILAGAQAQAREMQLKVNIAIVDDGGHLLAFARMDGARPASAYTAMTKATTAATLRQATGPVPPGTQSPDPLLNLSLQNAAAASGGKVTTLYGGVPILIDGQVIGAVGAGGATGEQDAEIARAGIARLLESIEQGNDAGDGN